MSPRGWLLFILMCAVWGIPYLLIKVSVETLNPGTLVFLRTAIAAAILLPWRLSRGRLSALRPLWWPLLAYTCAEILAPFGLLSSAEQHLSSSLSGLMIAFVPILGTVLGWVTGTGRQGMTHRRVLGLGLGVLGVAVLLAPGLSEGGPVPMLEILLVTVGYAVGPWIVANRLSVSGVSSLDVVTVSLTIAALAYTPWAILAWPAAWPGWHVAGAVLTLGVVCTALAFVAFFALIREIGPVRATVVTYVNPAVAVFLGVALLGEQFTPALAAGLVVIIGGSWLAAGGDRSGAAAPSG